MDALLDRTLSDALAVFAAKGLERGYLVRDATSDRVRASHPALDEVATALGEGGLGYHDHEAVFLSCAAGGTALFGAFLHATHRGQAQGGVRRRAYESLGAYLLDGLRLSHGMTQKSALAGLWWGGGKGLIGLSDPTAAGGGEARTALYRDYGRFVSGLGGCFVAAEDAGTSPSDVAEIFRTTRHVTCIPPAFGGSGNPSAATAAGVVEAIEAALAFREEGSLAGKRIVVQGLGQVGTSLCERLLERDVARVRAGEIDPDAVAAARRRFGDSRMTIVETARGDESLLGEPCDVLAPCALGGAIHAGNVAEVQARVVCGAANNPLADEAREGERLASRGITYVPDFVSNRMGIVWCANETIGHIESDPEVLRQLDRSMPESVYATTWDLLARARRENLTPTAAAEALAADRARIEHPLHPGRSRRIISAIVASGWAS